MGATSPSPEERVPIGSVLDGRYRIDAVLGSGGMGRVYRGEHTGIGRPVAIKVLHADLNRNSDAAKRFQREAIASGRLDHPNIVSVSDSGVLEDGAAYLVMEALEGEPLGERLAREHRLHWREALEILRGVLAGLHHAHDKGVVHRDIKPDNIFLARKDGRPIVKILDFGIAKLYQGSPDDPASTRAGLTVGTPAYLSPEQAVGGEITPASDLYSTTIVLYEMVTGRAPFEEKDPLAMLGAHVSRPPPPLAEVAPDLEFPPGFEDMILRGLAKTIPERIGSAADYLTWIDSVIAAAPQGAIGSAPVAVPDLGSLMQVLSTPPPGTLTPPALGLTAAIESIAPGQLAPGQLAPGQLAPGQLAPGQLAPGQLAPGQLAPGQLAGQPIGLTAALDAIDPKGDPTKVERPTPGAAKSLAPAAKPVSLADIPSVPRSWWRIAAIVVGALVVLAIVLAVALRRGKPAEQPDEPAKPDLPMLRSDPPAKPDTKAEVAAAIRELDDYGPTKNCETRRAAVARLAELGDPSAIPALKKHRVRWYSKYFGLKSYNLNACLTKDADEAIKKLSQ